MGFDNYLREIEGKTANDPYYSSSSNIMSSSSSLSKRNVWVPTPVIIGAGPAGMAAAACLKDKGIPSMILERSSCVGSLWQLKAYDRLKLHLPKRFCELPFMPFPKDFPKYPSKKLFVQYLEEYAEKFGIRPCFNRRVVAAEYDESLGVWRVRTAEEGDEVEYLCRWLVVATGENADAVVPDIEGMGEFVGSLGTSSVVHTSEYKSGGAYDGKKVLVVGCGNSGMEVCLDLCNYNAKPSVVVREAVHILPHEMLGTSTFGLSMFLLKWLPVRLVDWFLLAVTRLLVGDTGRYGLERPKVGPLELKSVTGKTPVLDVGTFERIKNGDIKIRPGIRRLRQHSVEFVDGRIENFDAIVLATGYKSNVPSWLKEKEMFSEKDGFPRRPFPNGWKGECGLYAAGFSRRGLLGVSIDARNIANDIESCWRAESDHLQANTWTKY